VTTALKQRIVGAIFILSLGVILIPLILDKPQISQEHEKEMLSHVIPDTPALPDVSDISKIHYVFNDIDPKTTKPIEPETNPEQPKPAPVLIPSDLAVTEELAEPLPPLLAEHEASQPLSDEVSIAEPAAPKATPTAVTIAPTPASTPEPAPTPAAPIAIPKVAQAPAPASAPTPAPVSKVHEKASASLAQASQAEWTIQLGAFSSEKNAKALVQKLSKGGFNPYLREMTQDSLVRVYVSPGIPREQAVDLAAKLDTEYGLKGIVVRYFQK
jgi:DedD protein